MPKFRKKPVVIEAEQFTEENKDRLFFQFVTCQKYADHDAEGKPTLKIQTLEGVMTATLGDWIIKGVDGEFYPCKPEIFEKTYEPVAIDCHVDPGSNVVERTKKILGVVLS